MVIILVKNTVRNKIENRIRACDFRARVIVCSKYLCKRIGSKPVPAVVPSSDNNYYNCNGAARVNPAKPNR